MYPDEAMACITTGRLKAWDGADAEVPGGPIASGVYPSDRACRLSPDEGPVAT